MMRVADIASALHLTPIAVSDDSRLVSGGYAGDLLSWVMGRAQQDEAWITIMSNVNVVAVATLSDVSMVILSENVRLDPEAEKQAASRDVNIYSSEEPTFTLCARISALLGGDGA